MRKELSKLKEELIDGNILLHCIATIYDAHLSFLILLETKYSTLTQSKVLICFS